MKPNKQNQTNQTKSIEIGKFYFALNLAQQSPACFTLLPSSAPAPAKLGWVALFLANPTTPTHPGKIIPKL